MLSMASSFRSTLTSWFTRKKRTAIEMETPDENTAPNIPLGAPNHKKRRLSIPRTSLRNLNAKRKLFLTEPVKQTVVKPQLGNDEWLTTLVTDPDHSMGWLKILPVELLHMIFHLLDKDTLAVISTVSRDLNNSVLNYIMSGHGLKHILPITLPALEHQLDELEFNVCAFNDAGILFRKVTTLQSLTRRLRIASHFSEKLQPAHECSYNRSANVMGYKCLGKLFSQYIRNWCEYDKLRAYCLVERLTKLEQKVSRVLRFSPGALPWSEWDLRQMLRNLLLDPCTSDEEYSFWMSQILKQHPITHQARLLFILTGPTNRAGFLYWSNICGCTSPTHSQTSPPIEGDDLSELARALRVLLTNRTEWNMDSIISIFDELTTTPCGWCLGQVAFLLMHSGTEVCQAILGNRAINGRVEELSIMAYYLAHSCTKEDKDKRNSDKLKWYIVLLQYVVAMIPNKKEKQSFSSYLLHHWHIYLTSLFDEDDIGDDSDYEDVREEFQVSLNCLVQLSILLVNHVAQCV